MKDLATQLGFLYSRKGCPCTGTPLVYTRQADNIIYTLTLWERRNAWRLTAKGCVIATGNTDNLIEQITKIIEQ